MKKNILTTWQPALCLALVLFFSSCIKDNCRRTYRIYTPVYENISTLRQQVKSSAVAPVANTGKLYINGQWIFLNEVNKGIHVIDNSQPTHPVKTSFIKIPGNIDMYVRNNTLYADLYSDLVAADISNPKNISVSKFLPDIFPQRAVYMRPGGGMDSTEVITGWTTRDTSIDCAADLSRLPCPNCQYMDIYAAQSSVPAVVKSSGVAGSMARFAAVDNYLYAVTTADLNIVDISNAPMPRFVKRQSIGWDIETIFPYNNKLFIGAGSSMRVYSLQDPQNPVQASFNGHWCSRDPVIVDGNYAYVTLHDADGCNVKINQLEVYNLSMGSTPVLVNTYPLTRPQGLSKDGNLLFICDDGLKIYDVKDPGNAQLLSHTKLSDSYDAIAYNNILYMVTKDGLYQYSYQDPAKPTLLSKLLK
ncbi:MAG TPA: hypothetical protein VL307_13635 [Chitinophagaceae bacterium]|nr:hypothetical protein [Chitinophagaceae bacterium]